jgi:hypothetical protein
MKSTLLSFISLISLIFLISLNTQAQDTVRVMHYNLLNYGNCSGVTTTQKDGWLETVASYYKPDILTVNEMSDRIVFANRIRTRALTYGDMEYTSFTNTTSSSIVNMLFYNPNKFGYKDVIKIGTALRDINVYTLYHLNSIQNDDTVFLYCIVAHLKASNDSGSQNQRSVAAQQIMNWMTNHPDAGGNFLLLGDLNIYGGNEGAWVNLVNNTNAIRFYDPIGLTNGWNAGNVKYMTQSTRCSGVGDCGVSGCLDDRFDFILPADAIMSGTDGISYVTNSYASLGNNGNIPFNGNLVTNCSVPNNICSALANMSDHFPVVMELAFLRSNGIDDLRAQIPDMKLQANNPFGDQLKVRWEKTTAGPTQVKWQLLDTKGKQCFLKQETLQTQKGELLLSSAQLPAGLYLLRVVDDKGRQLQQKLIKM